MPDESVKMMMEMQKDIAGIKAILSTMANTNEIAIKALESASSAHHRLNTMEEDIKSLEKNQNWLPKLITSTLITGILSGGIGFVAAKIFS